MTTLVIGGSGFLGQALLHRLGGGHATFSRSEPAALAHQAERWHRIDLAAGPDAEAQIDSLLSTIEPAVVVNAAYVASGDHLESVTAQSPGMLARACAEAGAHLVHVSSDVVFAGDRKQPYREADQPDPVHAYGEAKRTSERLVSSALRTATIVRTSLLYAGTAEHAQERLVRRAAADGDITFFTDEVRCPVAVDDVAAAVITLADQRAGGIFHVAGPVALDRLAFARVLAASLGVDPATLRGGPSNPATRRPRHVVLDTTKAWSLGITCRAPAEVLADR